jgi:hypothetical protein
MASRKKAKGKARKAAKVKTAEEGANESIPWQQLQRLQLSKPLKKREADQKYCINGMCYHVPNVDVVAELAPGSTSRCKLFIDSFKDVFYPQMNIDICAAHRMAYEATMLRFPDIWGDFSQMEKVISSLSSAATLHTLLNDTDGSHNDAGLAYYFEEMLAVQKGEKPSANFPKIFEMRVADEHTLVSYLKSRIPCSCLDDKYKEVKSVEKMGFCWNPDCPSPRVERSATLCCARCRRTNYCSKECQIAHWQRHKIDCIKFSCLQSAFDSRHMM